MQPRQSLETIVLQPQRKMQQHGNRCDEVVRHERTAKSTEGDGDA